MCTTCVCFPKHGPSAVPSACPQAWPGWVPATRHPPPVLHATLYQPGPMWSPPRRWAHGVRVTRVSRVRDAGARPHLPPSVLSGAAFPSSVDPPGAPQTPALPAGPTHRESHSDLASYSCFLITSFLFCFYKRNTLLVLKTWQLEKSLEIESLLPRPSSETPWWPLWKGCPCVLAHAYGMWPRLLGPWPVPGHTRQGCWAAGGSGEHGQQTEGA